MRLSFILKGGYQKSFSVHTNVPNWLAGDYSVVDAALTQNEVRRKLAILARMGVGEIWHDMVIIWHSDTKDFRIWVYTHNWTGRANYYAGLIAAYCRLCPKKKKNKIHSS